jgi:hypothetical protein
MATDVISSGDWFVDLGSILGAALADGPINSPCSGL